MKNLIKIICLLFLLTTPLYAQPSGGITRIWDGTDIAQVSSGGALLTDGSATIQPISGTVTCNAGTNLNTSALATSANQTTMITSLQLLDDVVATTGSAIPSKGNIISGTDGTNARVIKTNTLGNPQVGVIAQATDGYLPIFIDDVQDDLREAAQNLSLVLGGYYIYNGAATPCFLQLFDAAVAGDVTLGTTPPTFSFGLPAGAAANIPAVSPGYQFENGLVIAATTQYNNSTPCSVGMMVNLGIRTP